MYLYDQLQNKVKSLESMSLKFRQQQEALSAQLQDFLVYKLEAQEALNKEKQDSMSRYGALSSQHKLLKNQHEDLKRQLQELRIQHASLQLSHQQVQEENSHKEALLRKKHEHELRNMQETLLKLKEDSRSLRRTQDVVHAKQLTMQMPEEEEEEEEEADPARDPNNQGEDEFEEAELEHPQTEGEQILSQQKETNLKGAGLENPLFPVTVPVGHQHAEEEYEEDQEIENDDNGGEVDEDLEVVQMKSVKKRGAAEERDSY
ncbi:GOLI4 protein, partial [Polypterus senegalus]